MTRTKNAKNKRDLPESLTLIKKSLDEMNKSIRFLSKVRDGQEEGFDNKDKVSASKTLVDLGKHFFNFAADKNLFKDEEQEVAQQKQEEKDKAITGQVFDFKKL